MKCINWIVNIFLSTNVRPKNEIMCNFQVVKVKVDKDFSKPGLQTQKIYICAKFEGCGSKIEPAKPS